MTAEPARPPHGRLVSNGFAEDVREGLTAQPKWLKAKYFYDDLGSRLFEAICELPEYYVARAETTILRSYASEIAARLPPSVRLVELGSGNAAKSRCIIEALLERQRHGLDFIPVDISSAALERSAEKLRSDYPDLRVHPRLGDYMHGLGALTEVGAPEATRTLILFFGSTLGNLEPPEARELISGIRSQLESGDALLLGLDLKKSEEVLIPAYDDALGVTAAFNLNLLVRINRELGGHFDLRGFKHRVEYDADQGRIELYIVSVRDQLVPIHALGLEVGFETGEAILSECSYKFDRRQVELLAASTGFALEGWWTGPDELFASCMLVAR